MRLIGGVNESRARLVRAFASAAYGALHHPNSQFRKRSDPRWYYLFAADAPRVPHAGPGSKIVVICRALFEDGAQECAHWCPRCAPHHSTRSLVLGGAVPKARNVLPMDRCAPDGRE